MSLSLVNTTVVAASPEQDDESPFNYVPTSWVCILFIILFSLTTVAHVLQAFRLKVWYMLPTLALCGLVEIIGWAGRYWGHKSPYNRNPFLMQICTTIMAPSFMTAAMFLILPRIVSELGQEYSRMSPRLYPIIFLTADVGALLLQAIGGGVASSATTLEGANRGGNIMLAGIVIQLAAVALFDLLSVEFVIRYALGRPAYRTSMDREDKHTVPKRVALMLLGLGIASVFILIRSVYRTIELTDGWNGRIISTEKWFNWFDGGAIVAAMVTFNVFHPGLLIKDYGNKLLIFKRPPTHELESQEQKLPDQV
ncbi:RTA1-domain-containing protein [Rhizoctonia solani]|nr:RTA1-domain-containing protein [Rhizoctonia solani]